MILLITRQIFQLHYNYIVFLLPLLGQIFLSLGVFVNGINNKANKPYKYACQTTRNTGSGICAVIDR